MSTYPRRPRARRISRSSAACCRARYARLVGAGLALSALGDALLVWPQYFVAGMAAFAAAHLAYISAFGWGASRPLTGAACYAATGYFLTLLAPPGGLRVLVPLYGLLLATMAWRALAQARGRRLRSVHAAAAAGALLFLLSDAFLGYSLFGGTVPYRRVSVATPAPRPAPRSPLTFRMSQVAVMSTYYVGQLGIALSALDPPTPLATQSS